MKLPDLHDLEHAGVHATTAPASAIEAAAQAAQLRYRAVDLAHAATKAALLDAIASALHFPAHFGSNWDALADCLEDEDVVGKHGGVIRLGHAKAFREAHAHDWDTLTEILDEAAEYWRERHQPFWVFVA